MNETPITVVGNVTQEPELRYTPAGKAVVNFTVAATPRRKDGDRWVDGTTTFWTCEMWGQPAEHVAEGVNRGSRVIVQGIIRSETWTDKESGQERRAIRVVADEVGLSLKFGLKAAARASEPGDPAF